MVSAAKRSCRNRSAPGRLHVVDSAFSSDDVPALVASSLRGKSLVALDTCRVFVSDDCTVEGNHQCDVVTNWGAHFSGCRSAAQQLSPRASSCRDASAAGALSVAVFRRSTFSVWYRAGNCGGPEDISGVISVVLPGE